LPRRRAAVLAANGRLAEVVTDDELVAHPGLHRAMLLARAAGDPGDRVPALQRLTGAHLPDQATLAALWPLEWSIAEAAEVVAAVPGAYWRSPAMVARIDNVLRRTERPRDGAAWAGYRAICEFAVTRPVSDHLSAESREHVREMRRGREAIARLTKAKGSESKKILLDLVDQAARARGPARWYLESYLARAFLTVGAPVLTAALPSASASIQAQFWRSAAEFLQGKQADLSLAGALFEMRAEMPAKDRLVADLDRVLAETVAQWRSRDLDRLAEWIDKGPGDGTAGYFRKWREDNVRRGIGRFLPRRRG
jgi:hypothetical protein